MSLPSELSTGQADKARILLVEDSRSVAARTAQLLRTRGFDVTLAEDGQAGWEIMTSSGAEFDAILLDLGMPRMSGMEFLSRLKARPQFRLLPVVMVASVSDTASVREGLAHGAYYYLTKPFVPEMLVSIVTAAVDQHREFRSLHESLQQAERSFSFLESGIFRFRKIAEGQALANSLARLCANAEQVAFGLHELIVNAVEHGNLAIGYEEKSTLLIAGQWLDEINRRLETPAHRDKHVTLRFEQTPDTVSIAIADQGAGFDWRRYLDFDAERAFDNHGRGIPMARTLSFGSLQYVGNGNTAVATIPRAPDPPAG